MVVTSDEEDVRNTNKKYEMYDTPDEFAAEETEEKEKKVPVDLDTFLYKRGFKKGQGKRIEDITEEEGPSNRQDDRVCDDQDQKFNLPIHETTNIVNTACHRQWDEEDTACLIQKAVKKHSLVEDYIGEEGEKERHGSPKTYKIESSKGREMQPTNHKESRVLTRPTKGTCPTCSTRPTRGT